jgi:hypothetical protein
MILFIIIFIIPSPLFDKDDAADKDDIDKDDVMGEVKEVVE